MRGVSSPDRRKLTFPPLKPRPCHVIHTYFMTPEDETVSGEFGEWFLVWY